MWKEKTYYRGGGDVPHVSRRFYTYKFNENWFKKLLPYKIKFKKKFTTLELNTLGDEFGHRAVLSNPDFEINGINVMEWARNVIHKGKAEFKFIVDAGDPFASNRPQPPEPVLVVKFSDKRIASLFKLTFG